MKKYLPRLLLAVLLVTLPVDFGCKLFSGGFVNGIKKSEYAAAVGMDGSMKGWAYYYHAATNNPAEFGTTREAIEVKHQEINAIARRVSQGMGTLDTLLAAYPTNKASAPLVTAALNAVTSDTVQLKTATGSTIGPGVVVTFVGTNAATTKSIFNPLPK